jgi:hypothetical protein
MGFGAGMGFGMGGSGGVIGGKPQPGPSASSSWGLGRGGITNSQWVGQPENFNIGDEPVRLNLRTRPEALTGSQPLLPGPAATEEVIAPPTPSGSGIPLSRLLPTYTQRAEQALSQQTIPPSERQRVRRYFDALRQGTE